MSPADGGPVGGRELRYDRPAAAWLDGLPLGDGRTGAMVLAGPRRVHLQLTDGTGWSGGVGSAARRGLVDPETAADAGELGRALVAVGRHVEAERVMAAVQGDYVQAFLPFADVRIDVDLPDAPAAAFRRRLVLRDATHRTTADDGALTHETFVSAPDGVLVHVLRSARPADVRVTLSTPLRETGRDVREDGAELRLDLPADVAPGHEPDEPGLTWDVPGVRPLAGALVAGWRHDGDPGEPDGAPAGPGGADGGHGGAGADDAGASDGAGDAVLLRGVRELVLVLATATTFDGLGREPRGTAADAAGAARARVRAALDLGADALRDRHLADRHALADRFALDLGGTVPDLPTDERVRRAAAHPDGPLAADADLLALLVDHGRYLLSSASRPGGLPVTLQGLWNDDLRPPWSSAYTLNINTQMAYWPALPAALPETAEPLLDLVTALADRGRDAARRLYGARGWVAHHNTDAWANPYPTAGDASWALWPMGGAWLVRQLDEHRRHGLADDAWLRRFWPVARGAAEALLDLLEPAADPAAGLVTWPSTSPENRFRTPDGPAALTTGTGMDRALVAELFDTVTAVARDLGVDDPVLPEIAAARPLVAGPRVAPDGAVAEWGPGAVAEDPHHRHVSHLVFAYPGDGVPDERLRAAVAATLDRRGDDSTGWSLAWKAALRARLGQGARVQDLLALALRPAWDAARGPHAGGLYRNLFAAHPPYQVDGNLGLVAAVTEALVQSHAGRLELLPALPPALRAGRVEGLLARPGLRVDLAWREGRPVTVALTPVAPGAAGEHEVAWGSDVRRVRVAAGRTALLRWAGP